MFGGDEVNAVVLDCGTTNTRLGFAGEDSPKVVVSTHCGRVEKELQSMEKKISSKSNNESKGPLPKLLVDRGPGLHLGPNVEVFRPVQQGIVEDWDAVEALWEHCFKRLSIDVKNTPILSVDPLFNTKKNRDTYLELMFEKWETPATYLGQSPMLSSFASGRSCSLVVDIGGGTIDVTPVYDGFCLKTGARRAAVAGEYILDLLKYILFAKDKSTVPCRYEYRRRAVKKQDRRGQGRWRYDRVECEMTDSARKLAESKVLQEIVEETARVAESPFLPGPRAAKVKPDALKEALVHVTGLRTLPPTSYELPDGCEIDLTVERCAPYEALFYSPDKLAGVFDSWWKHGGLVSTSYADWRKQKQTTSGQKRGRSRAVKAHSPVVAFPHPPMIYGLPTEYRQHGCSYLPSKFDFQGLPHMMMDAIHSVDVDITGSLCANILLCGGVSVTDGLDERVSDAINKPVESGSGRSVHKQTVKIVQPSHQNERIFSAWMGGSILASLGSFHQMWYSRAEWMEFGDALLARKMM